MSWFGWGQAQKFKDKEGNMIDTSGYSYAYEFYLVFIRQPEEIDMPGFVLAEKLASEQKETDFLKFTEATYTEIVRHEDASQYGGKGVILNRNKEFLPHIGYAVYFHRSDVAARKKNTVG